MRTRRAIYPAKGPCLLQERRLTRSSCWMESEVSGRCERLAKRAKEDGNSKLAASLESSFDKLPDDLLISILVFLSSTADSPQDLINTVLTCKRFGKVALSPPVLSKASERALRVRASQWCPAASTFLAKCAQAGNLEACFTLGMIKFYCLMERKGGLELMARAATGLHASALHALGVIQFNGSGGGRADKNLKAGVRLCARAASLRHVDALRELGHCLQDGYGVPKNVFHGRRIMLEANVIEAFATTNCERIPLCLSLQESVKSKSDPSQSLYQLIHKDGGASFLSDFGCCVAPPSLHIAQEFLLGWFHMRPLPFGLRMCSHANCGRPETREHEFRRCSACGHVNYCSRACQALDWKLQHKLHCGTSTSWHNHALDAFTRLVGVNAMYIDEFGD